MPIKKLNIKFSLLICSLIMAVMINVISYVVMPNISNTNTIKLEQIYDSRTIYSKVYAEEVYKVPDSSTKNEVKKSDYVDAIDKIEGGSTFENVIAKVFANLIGSLMGILSSATEMKTLDGLVFNTGSYVDGFTPLAESDWTNINQWYVFMIALSAGLLLVAIFTIFVKLIKASGNVHYRQEAINSLKRLGASALIICLTPIFIHLLLYINNNLVYAFYTKISGGKTSLESSLGGVSVLSSLDISSPLAGVVILGLFAYLQLKLNILFIIRNFNLIVFTIFTPFATTIWIMDENINGAKVWLGELLSNIFMQMSYAFLFSLYLSFMGGKGWLTQLVWGNLIIALGDVIRNMLQGKLTQLSGINEIGIAGKAVGGGAFAMATGLAALGGTAKAFKAQIPTKSAQTNIDMNTQPNVIGRNSSLNGTPMPNNIMPNNNVNSNSQYVENPHEQYTENPSFADRAIRTGNKITRVGAGIAKGAFNMAAMPIAMASGDTSIVKSVKDIGNGIENGVNKIGAPIGRMVGASVEKAKETPQAQYINYRTNEMKEKISNKVSDNKKNNIKTVSQILTGKSSDDIMKFR